MTRHKLPCKFIPASGMLHGWYIDEGLRVSSIVVTLFK